MNTVSYFEIQATDPSRLVAFYKKIFGWKILRDPAIPIEYHRIETTSISGAILKRPSSAPPGAMGTNAFTCSIEVADFDRTASLIAAEGGHVAMPKFAIPGKCWQGYFIDPDGNIFGLFEVDSNAT